MKRSPLKRGDKPLQRKTPMAKREPMKSGAPLARTGRLKPRSDKTAAIYREERVPFVARLLEERPDCQAKLKNCTGRSQDVHEIVSRARGGSITDEANALCLCRRCHDFITEQPIFAQVMGFSRHSWERDGGDDPNAWEDKQPDEQKAS